MDHPKRSDRASAATPAGVRISEARTPHTIAAPVRVAEKPAGTILSTGSIGAIVDVGSVRDRAVLRFRIDSLQPN
jgi:hypothetical protein